MSRLEGVDELRRKLDDLGRNVGGRIARTALRDGAKVMQGVLRDDAPSDSGQTKAAIKVRSGKRSRAKIGMMVTLNERFFKNQFYVGFVNWGWIWSRHKRPRIRVRGKDGRITTTTPKEVGKGEHKIEGSLWLEKSWARGYEATVSKVRERIAELINALNK
jgi:HK97 gp10 family phage protein